MKPKKTAEELVQMLHDEKGIQFHLISEEQAVECFSQRNNYLRTASYRKNYPKHIAGPNAGKYIHLEFAYLAELSTLDFYLRELLLQMCMGTVFLGNLYSVVNLLIHGSQPHSSNIPPGHHSKSNPHIPAGHYR